MCEEYRYMKREMKMSFHMMHVQSIRATQSSKHPKNFAVSDKNGSTTFFPNLTPKTNKRNGRP